MARSRGPGTSRPQPRWFWRPLPLLLGAVTSRRLGGAVLRNDGEQRSRQGEGDPAWCPKVLARYVCTPERWKQNEYCVGILCDNGLLECCKFVPEKAASSTVSTFASDGLSSAATPSSDGSADEASLPVATDAATPRSSARSAPLPLTASTFADLAGTWLQSRCSVSSSYKLESNLRRLHAAFEDFKPGVWHKVVFMVTQVNMRSLVPGWNMSAATAADYYHPVFVALAPLHRVIRHGIASDALLGSAILRAARLLHEHLEKTARPESLPPFFPTLFAQCFSARQLACLESHEDPERCTRELSLAGEGNWARLNRAASAVQLLGEDLPKLGVASATCTANESDGEVHSDLQDLEDSDEEQEGILFVEEFVEGTEIQPEESRKEPMKQFQFRGPAQAGAARSASNLLGAVGSAAGFAAGSFFRGAKSAAALAMDRIRLEMQEHDFVLRLAPWLRKHCGLDDNDGRLSGLLRTLHGSLQGYDAIMLRSALGVMMSGAAGAQSAFRGLKADADEVLEYYSAILLSLHPLSEVLRNVGVRDIQASPDLGASTSASVGPDVNDAVGNALLQAVQLVRLRMQHARERVSLPPFMDYYAACLQTRQISCMEAHPYNPEVCSKEVDVRSPGSPWARLHRVATALRVLQEQLPSVGVDDEHCWQR
eukprot:TRINITY_DN28290_c0_g1_i1.p1 TRINITY_DN28290_c0_g1~~TRINITY_DN28290_c0_g1_i1.p1  ORF type:complete len:679 (+),score=160.24 TRINITY_DN28290_c0_g1_i1:71-2038(+)